MSFFPLQSDGEVKLQKGKSKSICFRGSLFEMYYGTIRSLFCHTNTNVGALPKHMQGCGTFLNVSSQAALFTAFKNFMWGGGGGWWYFSSLGRLIPYTNFLRPAF